MDFDMDMDTDTDRDMEMDMECEMDIDMNMEFDPLSVKSARKNRKNLAGYQQILWNVMFTTVLNSRIYACAHWTWFIFNLQIKKGVSHKHTYTLL
jgi:hypothetical protein